MKYLTAALVAVFLWPQAATANQNCASHEAIVTQLEQKFGERLAGFGIDGRGNMIEFYFSPENRTWTFVFTNPDGKTCLGAAGGEWQPVEVKPTEEQS